MSVSSTVGTAPGPRPTPPASPWLLDVLLTPDRDGRWVNRRHRAMDAPLEEVTWVRADGVRFLDPEVALLFKAQHRRPQDEEDLATALPRLSQQQRARLYDALAVVHPGHPWLPPFEGGGPVGTGGA